MKYYLTKSLFGKILVEGSTITAHCGTEIYTNCRTDGDKIYGTLDGVEYRIYICSNDWHKRVVNLLRG